MKLSHFVILLILFVSSANALTYRYDGNKTFIISNDAGTVDFGEIQVLNNINRMTFTDGSPFQLDMKFRFNTYRNLTKPGGQQFDMFLDKIQNRTHAEVKAIRGLVWFNETRRNYFTDQRFVWNEVNSTFQQEFFLNYTTEQVSGYRWQDIDDLGDLEAGSRYVGNKSYYFTVTLERNVSSMGSIDLQPMFWGMRFRELAWWNTTYSYCRNIMNLNETQGLNVVNEPLNHGHGVYVDATGWGNKPSTNGLAVINAPCGQDGSIVPFEVLNGTITAPCVNCVYDQMRLLFFVNLTPYQNTSYSLYFSTTAVGRPFFNTTGDVAAVIGAGNATTITAGGFAINLNRSKGGSYTWTYQGFQYDYSGNYGYPTFAGTQTQNFYTYNGDTPVGVVGCHFVFNSSLVSILNCTNSATAIAMQYRRYASFGTGSNLFVDYTYYPPAGGGNVTNRQDFSNTQTVVRAQDASGTYGSVTTSNLQPQNGAVGINFTGQPGRKAMMVLMQNNSRGATHIQLDTSGGGNSQVNFWNKGGASQGIAVLNYTADARVGIYNGTTLDTSGIDQVITNASGVFRNGIGGSSFFGAEQQNSGVTVSNPSHNNTKAGNLTLFKADIVSVNPLVNFTFEFDNGNGTLTNQTFSITGTTNVSNATAYLNATVGSTIRYRFYACDTGGVCSASSQTTFTTTDANAPQWFNPSVNHTQVSRLALFQTNWTDVGGLFNYTFEFDNGNGTMVTVSLPSNSLTGTANLSNATAYLNSTPVSIIRWRMNASDASGNRNSTGILSFNTTSDGAPNYSGLSYSPNTNSSGANTTFEVVWAFGAPVTGRCWVQFFFDNGTGTLNNIQNVTNACGTSIETHDFSLNVNQTAGSVIRWYFSANSTYNASFFNTTPIQSFTTNSLFLISQALNEITLTPVTFSLIAQNSTTTINFGGNLTSFSNLSTVLPQGAVTLTFANGSYARHFFLQIDSSTVLNRTLYLIPNSYAFTVGLSIQVTDFVNFPISGALVNLQKTINNENVLLDQALTTTSGQASFQVDCLSIYVLNITSPTGINEINSITLDCAGGNSFKLQMGSGSTIIPLIGSPFQNVTAYLSPSGDIYDPYTLINFVVASSTNNFQYYNLSIYYANGTSFYNGTGTNLAGGNLSFNLTKAGKSPYLIFNTTFKEFTMNSEYTWSTTKQINLVSNGTAPSGLSLPNVQAAFPGFVYTIIPIVAALFATGFVIAIAPATQGGVGLLFLLFLVPFVIWGWISFTIWMFFGAAGLALTYLIGRWGR